MLKHAVMWLLIIYCLLNDLYCLFNGEHGSAVSGGTALQTARSRVRFPIMSLTKSFRPHYDPGVDSASKKMSTRNISWG